eukprot:646953-Rhodomonas_salina.2
MNDGCVYVIPRAYLLHGAALTPPIPPVPITVAHFPGEKTPSQKRRQLSASMGGRGWNRRSCMCITHGKSPPSLIHTGWCHACASLGHVTAALDED